MVDGKVYHRIKGGCFRTVASGIDFANGVAVSPDGLALFVGESKTDNILRYAIAVDGSLGDRAVVVNVAKLTGHRGAGLKPDGIRIDREGRLFVALYDGAGLVVIGSDGSLVARIDLPGAHHISLGLDADEKSLHATAIDADSHGAVYRIANPLHGAM